ncbi:uncharacterized protein LOC121431381 [Lytechinus variegatus]|uniref:uncharacterized protein LOC121431381 n=1 Tax=Lytechinus variegatus TaxID=7654 RepID=UPI001BB1D8B4|nr:uncharacterized protein LOC121431381 [Lytechinus variegatus]
MSSRGSSTMSTKESTENAVTKSEATTDSPVPTLQGNLRGQNTAAIAAACSVVALVVLVVVIIIVCIRKRSRNPKTAAPHEKDEDESNLYNNPVYCSNDGGLPIPDLIVGTTSNDGRSTLAPLKPADVDSQSKEFEGHRHLNTNIGDSHSHGNAFSGIISESGELNPVTYYSLEDPSAIAVNDDALNEDDYHTYEQAITPSKKPDEATTKVPKGTGSLYQDLDQLSPSMNAYSSLVTKNDLPKHGTQNGGKDGQTDGSAVLDDELEYNALNFNKSSDVTRALKTPAGVSDIKANNGYGVLDLPKEGHSEQSTQLHNDDVYNTIGGSPHEQDNTKQPPPESFSGYQALNHGPPDPQISRQGLNPQRVPPVSPGEYQSLSTGPKGSGPKMEASGSDQPDDGSEYHSYQDPRQMDMNGSVPREPNAFSSDQYNILNSGKEVGDYHVYQSTTEDGMDEGTYEDFNSKTSHDDEYSTVNQMKIQDPKAVDAATFEPIYSEEVYSEFQ